MNVQRDEHQPHWKSRGEEARGQLGLCTQDMAAEPCREVQGQGQMCRACHRRCCHHAAPQDGIPPDSAPGRRLLGSEGSETPSAPVPHQRHPAHGQLRRAAGTWFLVAVASACRSLQEQGHRAEATTLHVTPQGAAMAVSTFRKLDGICWQVRQLYGDTGLPGRFLLQARGARGAVDVVVGETDYRGFAILYLERARQLSVKLYARSLPVSESFLSVFEQRVQGANLTEDHTLFFPKYGECPCVSRGPPRPPPRPGPATPDPSPGPQVSARPRTSFTSWMVSGQRRRGGVAGGWQRAAPSWLGLVCAAEVRR
ncbi:complement component C8 gamma chain isoform X2 [Phocoena sinus]|uniref:complement component C8 gamma chain isoform X2 n=1 Tax=Phocoena sinus TaxID=42100 RepID=UPI0013C4DAB5|nr:complement component C8 gamma chain isoform X2 [Phocoena sinus]